MALRANELKRDELRARELQREELRAREPQRDELRAGISGNGYSQLYSSAASTEAPSIDERLDNQTQIFSGCKQLNYDDD